MNAVPSLVDPSVSASFGSPALSWSWRNFETEAKAITRKVEAERRMLDVAVARPEEAREQSNPTEQLEIANTAFFAIPEFRALPADSEQVFAASKEWEGSIQSIGNSHFVAELHEIRPKADEATDIAEIPIGDVPAADRALLREGAIFRYLVGYAKTNKGTVTRKRLVYVRRGRSNPPADEEALWLETAAMFRNDS